ncbi:glycosyltransferase family 2 protein [Sporolactobacillus sp. STSJ-5]|uniref:glycosyltransferase family 2 protein n=1 Tax=Sporolactobacillus sp. STSJ-5 TaxID=2965076 RepID=UPI0021031959|nr:glycosyltransferase family 2 protein [Sporolactobacillus sp. STSJ-5]MCQ2009524.1 glycosyltransferase family 2 protein [Sporolactobacillus sp. STSJ-5]
MDNAKEKVAIIILNWNAYEETYECLCSLEKLKYKKFHVFLVDNASTDYSFDKLKMDGKKGKFKVAIDFIQSGDNLGFAGGNNVAIRKAYNLGHSYFWMINNDTVVDENSLTYLIDEFVHNNKTGIAGSKILYYNSDIVWFAGGIVNTYLGKTKHIGFKMKDSALPNLKCETGYVTGCSLFFRKEVIDSIGLMQEDYFLYYEETDWNLRAKNSGWKIVYVPQSRVYHKVSTTTGSEKSTAPFVAYYDIRNAFLMIKRTQRNKIKVITAYVYKWYNTVKKTIKLVVYNQDQKKLRLRYIIKGLFDNT